MLIKKFLFINLLDQEGEGERERVTASDCLNSLIWRLAASAFVFVNNVGGNV